MTKIEWTDEVWNATRGCSRVSPGCDHCWAMGQARRQDTPGGKYEGLTIYREGGARPGVDWAGTARLAPEMLDRPLRWKAARRIFVNSMSDLFHESLTNEDIAAIFGVMAACPQHTFQVLTKRPKRAAAWFAWIKSEAHPDGGPGEATVCGIHAANHGAEVDYLGLRDVWPLPNVHLGVSAENQDTYNERVPVLVHQCPAALYWVSIEPQLGPIRLRGTGHIHLGWVVQGGESGNGARPFEAEWVRDMRADCAESGIPYFLKQLGAAFEDPANGIAGARAKVPTDIVTVTRLKNRKGGDMSEWPEALRVREFPAVRS